MNTARAAGTTGAQVVERFAAPYATGVFPRGRASDSCFGSARARRARITAARQARRPEDRRATSAQLDLDQRSGAQDSPGFRALMNDLARFRGDAFLLADVSDLAIRGTDLLLGRDRSVASRRQPAGDLPTRR
jgi:hypothetical protein